MAENATTLPTVPSGWVLLSASNVSGSPQQIASTVSGWGTLTSWLAAHVYGSNEPTTYNFTHYNNNGTELGALLVAYRGANQNLNNYTAYGFTQNALSPSFSFGAISPPGQSTLVAVTKADGGCDSPETTEFNETLAAPSGTPTLTAETSLTSLPSGWLAADAGVPTAGLPSYGPYSFSISPSGTCTRTTASWLAWGVAIPE